jgi:signal transduction histidine kinase
MAAAAVHKGAGRSAEAAAIYAAIEKDFPVELRQIVRPSRAQIALCRIQALDGAGRRPEARALALRILREIEAAGPASLESGDVGLLVEAALALAPGQDPVAEEDYRSSLGMLRAAQVAAERSFGFARACREWILPRIARGGEPERFLESDGPSSQAPGSQGTIVAWTLGKSGSGIEAAGFRVRPEGAFASLMDHSPTGPGPLGNDPDPIPGSSAGALPLQVEWSPEPGVFKDLTGLPGALGGFRIGLDRASWDARLGTARRPFRIALMLISILGLFLALGTGLGLRLLAREMFLARMKTEFVANVSHELKTPLALIRLFGETLLLDRVRDSAKAKEYFGIIVRESERLTHLVNNILDFSSLEAGRKTYDFRPLDLGRVVEETLAAYRFQLEERGFQVGLEVSPGLPATLADPDSVAQALINLLNNSVKYSPGEKEIQVKAFHEGGAIRVSVADRGIGIAHAERKRIFEDFYRSPAARRLGTRGSGLGLSLVRRIAEAHGGSVDVASTLGQGSTFTLSFPVRRPAGAGKGSGMPAADHAEGADDGTARSEANAGN